MNVAEFSFLNPTVQQRMVLKNGVFLSKRKSCDLGIYLFQLGSFYVELVYLLKTRQMEWVNAFENTDLLEPYLQQIDISQI